MNKLFSLLGFVSRKTLFPLVLALPLVSCYQPTEKTLVSRPPSSYGERPGQGYASVALERQDSGRGVVAVERVPSGAGGAIVADSSGSFDLDGLELASVEGQAPTYAAYESLSEGGLSLGEGVSSAGLNTPYRSTTLSDADVGGAMSLLEQVGRSGGGLLASQALGYGNSYLNRAGEGLLTGLVEGSAARLNFRLNGDGDFSGEGDAFLPFYDSTLSTAFAQIGVRSMDGKGADAGWKGLEEDTRWIGNFGVGQRWYPFAQGQGQGRSDGPWMVGYNAFLDADFSRSHLRGGVGLETQYDWMHLAGNYYFPLSGWKDGIGEDADRNIVYQERAAEGFDLRLKGYVPFYRNVAVTGSYGQWFGKHVSGSNTNDPSSWSYGVEYTPIPLLTAYVRQEELDGGKSSTDFGIRLTYRGGMSWEEQVSHAKVADLTKMTRNAFVERENRIITEQQQKASDPSGKSKFGLDLVDKSPFKVDVRRDDVTFRVLDPQDPSGVARGVHLTLEWENVQDAFAHELPLSAETDKDGYFTIETGLTAKQAKLVMLTVTHDDGSSRRTAVPAELSLEEWPVRLVDVPVTRMDTGSRTFQVVERHGEAAPTPVWDGKKLNVTLKYKSGKTVRLPAPVTIGTNGEFSLTEDVVKGAVSLEAKLAGEPKDEPDQREIDHQLSEVPEAPEVTLTLLAPDSFYVGIEAEPVFLLKDVSGEPVRDEKNIALSWGTDGVFNGLPPTVGTNRDGKFSLPGLKGLKVGETALTAKLTDGRTAASQPLRVVSRDLVLKTLTPDPFYVGVAKDAKFRLEDASGKAVANQGGIAVSWNKAGVFEGLSPTVATDARGEFTLPGLKGLRVDETALTAKLSDGRTATSVPVKSVSAGVTLSLQTTDPFYVGIAKAATFRLTDASGKALANQGGVALSWVKAGVFEGLPPTVTTDAKGEFTLPSLKGLTVDETALTATLSDGRSATSVPVKSVSAGVTLSLLTTDPFYVGVAKEARFSLTDASGKALANQGGVALSWVKAGVFEGLPPTVTTDAKGEFTLPGLKGLKVDETALTATLSDGRSATSVPVKSVSAGVTLSLQTTDPFYVGIAKAATFRLTDASGKALANQGGVALSWVKAGVFEGLPPTVTTDAKGEFTLPSLKGLKVDETALTATLSDGRSATSVPVKSVSAGVTLSLLTTDPFYVGVAKEARFSLTDASGKALANQGGVALSWVKAGVFEGLPPTVTTDAKGEFTLPGLKGLKVDETALTAKLADGRTATSTPVKSVSAGVTLSLLTTDPFYVGIAKEARFSLTDASGNALANQGGVALSWVKAGVFEGLPPTVTTDAKGEFTLPGLKGLKVDETALTATLSDGRSATSVPVKSVSAGVTLSLLTTDPFYVGIAKEATFRLTDASGKALANQGGVALSWVKAGVFEGLSATVATDAKGEFTLPSLKGLKVDETALTATLSDGRSATSVPVKSVNGAVTLSLLTTDPFYVGIAKEAKFRLIDASGNALANQGGVALSWVKTGVFEGLPPTVATDAQGAFSVSGLKGLRVDETALTAKLTDGRTATSAPVKSVNGAVTLSLLTTDPFYVGIAKEATFRLIDASGNALANQGGVALNWVKTGVFEGLSATVATDAQGEFAVPGLKGLRIDETALTAKLADGRTATSAPLKVKSAAVALNLLTTDPFYVGVAKEAKFRLTDAASGQAVANQGGIGLSWVKTGVFEGLPATVSTDAQGEFALPGLKGLRIDETALTAKLSDGPSATSTLVKSVSPALTLEPASDHDEWLEANTENVLTYFVKDSVGVPVRNRMVSANVSVTWGSDLGSVSTAQNVQTTADGMISLLRVAGGGAGGKGRLKVTLRDGDVDRTGSRSLLVRDLSLRLELVEPAGPFYVGVAKEAKFRLINISSGQAVPNQTGIALSWRKTGVFEDLPATVATDAQGEFVIPGLKALTVDETALTARLTDGRSATSAPVKSVNATTTLSLLTQPPFYVGIAKEAKFRLSDAFGRPLANQSGISLSWVKSGVFEGLPTTVATDAQGEFALPDLKGLTVGETALTAKLADSRTATSAQLKAESTTLTLSLLTTDPFYVGIAKEATFRLTDALGQAVANQSGVALSWGKTGVFEGVSATVATDGKGEFVLPGLKALTVGETALTAKLTGGLSATSAPVKSVNGAVTLSLLTTDPFYVGVAKEAKFRLIDASGNALANQSGIALSWAKAGVFEGLSATVVTDAQGEFVLPGLKGLTVGETALTATLPGRRSATSAPVKSVSAGVTLSLLTTDPFYVGIAKEARFSLTDASGNALANQSGVALSWVKAGVFEGLSATVATDGKGEFSVPGLKGLTVGETALTAKLVDGRTATSSGLKTEDGTISLIVASGGTKFSTGTEKSVEYLVLDAVRKPIGNAKNIFLSWRGPDSDVFPAASIPGGIATNVDGRFRLLLTASKVGQTTLRVELEDGRSAVSAIHDVAEGVFLEEINKTTLRYPGINRDADFRLRTASGGILANQNNVQLIWQDADVLAIKPVSLVNTGHNGEFILNNIEGAKPGSARLAAVLPDGRRSNEAAIVIYDPALTVTSVSDKDASLEVNAAKNLSYYVKDAYGTPVQNRSLKVEISTPSNPGAYRASVQTTSEGRLDLAGVNGGTRGGRATLKVTLVDIVPRVGEQSLLVNDPRLYLKPVRQQDAWFVVGETKGLLYYLKDASGNLLKDVPVYLQFEGSRGSSSYGRNLTIGSDGILRTPMVMGGANTEGGQARMTVTTQGLQKTTAVWDIPVFSLPKLSVEKVETKSDAQGWKTHNVVTLRLDGLLNPRVGKPSGSNPAVVDWSVVSVDGSRNAAVVPGWERKATGLTWGDKEPETNRAGHTPEISVFSQNVSSQSGQMQLKDIVGNRSITVKASIAGFGDVSLKVDTKPLDLASFSKPPVWTSWADPTDFQGRGMGIVNGVLQNGKHKAITICGGTTAGMNGGGYHPQTKTGSEGLLLKVGSGRRGYGAAYAAGWPDGPYWTEAFTGVKQNKNILLLSNFRADLTGNYGAETHIKEQGYLACVR